MRLPLLVGARPQFTTGGPSVKLSRGRWAITTEYVKDSVLHLLRNGNSPTPLPCEIEGPCDVRVIIHQRGNEEYINAFAERLR